MSTKQELTNLLESMKERKVMRVQRIEDLEKLIKQMENTIETDENGLTKYKNKFEQERVHCVVLLTELNVYREEKGLKPKEYQSARGYEQMSYERNFPF